MKEILTSGALAGTFPVPGSKSLTNRALICASLAAGESLIVNPSDSDDTALLINGLNLLGVLVRRGHAFLRVSGTGGVLTAPKFPIPVGNAGTTFRFLLSVAALARGMVSFDMSERMAERPNDDLYAALEALGCTVNRHSFQTRCDITGGALKGGRVRVAGTRSSQFLSSLMMVAPFAAPALEIAADGVPVSASYLDLTVDVMSAFGVEVGRSPGGVFTIPAGIRYRPCEYIVEPDASAASYPWAAAAITGGNILVPGIGSRSHQGDIGFLTLLRSMGATVMEEKEGVRVLPGKELRGIDVDMNGMPDVVPTLAVTALFATGTTRIRNVAHLRHKESDRLHTFAGELRKLGGAVEVYDDGLEIRPGPLHGSAVDAHHDHRLAMSLALIGLRVPGVLIAGPECVRKSFPRFWEILDTLRGGQGEGR